MKKIFTIILAAAGTISSASAQFNHQKNIAYNDHKAISNDYIHQDSYGKTNSVNYGNTYFSKKEKEIKLANITHAFDQKIAFVKSKHHLSAPQKRKQIQLLQKQREIELNIVASQYAVSKKGGYKIHKW